MDVAAEVLIAITLLLAVCMALTGMRPSTMAQRDRAAMESYRARQWPQAFEALSELADAGDAHAARVAELMARQGPQLFGHRFDVSPERLARWDRVTRDIEQPGDAAEQVAIVGRAAVALQHAPAANGVPELGAARR
ncbi:MAG TPA: hypothetical protein VH328_11365 [Burkholderiaceae bacterium]|nr:hypothetical protein [Burkholderiaceae bacterium]